MDKNKKDKDFIEKTKVERELLVKYKDTIGDIIKAKGKYKTGKGIFFYFSPQELIKDLNYSVDHLLQETMVYYMNIFK